VTLTMRPHFWRIMSWTRARDSAIGALVWTADQPTEPHCQPSISCASERRGKLVSLG
jgi:hypothetical protein